MTEQVENPTKVVTHRVRLSYAHLFEPAKSNFEGQEPKYSVVILIPKNTPGGKEDYKKLRAAQKAALEKGRNSKFGGTIPKKWKDTIHDGDEEADLEKNPEYEGHWYLSVSAKTRPGIVDRDMNDILDQTEVYSGCYARVSVNAFPYAGQAKGVSFGLNHVQKLGDGEHLGGAFTKAEDDFAEPADEDEDDMSVI